VTCEIIISMVDSRIVGFQDRRRDRKAAHAVDQGDQHSEQAAEACGFRRRRIAAIERDHHSGQQQHEGSTAAAVERSPMVNSSRVRMARSCGLRVSALAAAYSCESGSPHRRRTA